MKIFYSILFFLLIWISIKAQKVDSTSSVIKMWSIENSWKGIEKADIDTFPTSFQNYLPYRSNLVGMLGNGGSATFPLTYNLPDEETPFFYIPYKIYYNSDRNIFYNTRKPYTRINFAAGTSKEKGEQYITVLHTQNVTPDLNFSFRANGHNSKGYYLHQENRNNSFRISTNYIKNKYKLHAYYNFEKFRLTENGGILHDDYIIDSIYKPENLNVNLSNAKNTIAFREAYVHQEISLIGKTDSIDSVTVKHTSYLELHHTGSYQWFKKHYTDIPDSSFYNYVYIDSTATNDSSQTETLFQNISLVLTENNPLKTAFLLGVNYDQRSYYFYYSDTLLNSFGIQASVFKHSDSLFSGYFNIEQWLSGYLKGNSKYDGMLSYKLRNFRDIIKISLSAEYWTRHPDYYQNRYYSNNFNWNNNFANSYYSKSTLRFDDSWYNTGFSLNFNTVKNYIYFDSLALPKQQNHTIKIMSADIYKNFKIGKHIHFNNRAVIQQSSNDSILRLPMYVGVHSLFYEFLVFKKVLKVQLGAEVYFFTKYFAPKYIPATSQFAIQNERQTGNYPFVDAFVNLNWKRARIFVKLEHANYTLVSLDYFMTPHYPVPVRNLKFGISWNFYD